MSEAYIPGSLQEALDIKKEKTVVPVAGGTDVMVQNRRPGSTQAVFQAPLLLLHKVEALKRIQINRDWVIVGAGVLLNELAQHQEIPALLRETARQMAAVTTRNVATIGGNICNASPAADMLPFLYAANARLMLKSAERERKLPVNQFITGPGQTLLNRDELLVEIHIPHEHFDVEYHRKVGTRRAMALSKVAFAGMASFSGGRTTDIRMALGAVAPKVIRSQELEQQFTGLTGSELRDKIGMLRKGYAPLIRPIDDARSSARYRKHVALDMLTGFVEKQVSTRHELRDAGH